MAVVPGLVLLVTACGGAQPSPPGPTSVAQTLPVTTPATTAQPTATPMPTADVAHPVGIIAIGHSGLTGEGTAGAGEDDKTKSWATGTSPDVDSVYSRLVAALPETAGHVDNMARGGAVASALAAQATSALAIVPAPLLAIIQTLDNDIQCDGANVADVGQSVLKALKVIHEASPNTHILVVGQLGRPSIAYVEALVKADPSAKADLTWDDPCSFYDAAGDISKTGFQMLSAVIDRYEAETARVCATVPNCTTDGGVRKAWIDKIELFSGDYAHLNVKGQAAEAEQIWPVVEQLLGL